MKGWVHQKAPLAHRARIERNPLPRYQRPSCKAFPGIPLVTSNRAFLLCSADPWTWTDLGPETGPDRTGREHLGLDRFQKTDPYHQIIIRSFHHIIISYHHHITISSHHCIITISHHQDTVVIQTHDQKIPKFQNFTRHFLANSADRPEICATIGGIMQ